MNKPASTEQNIPKKIGKYEIYRQLGYGSMGTVYEGYDVFMHRRVALKVANSQKFVTLAAAERYKKSFFNEAHAAGKLQHPNIVEIFDAGAENDTCYIAMELIQDGNTLAPYCEADNLLSYHQVAEVISKCATALDYAHRFGVIHRDIKPTNILCTKDMDIKLCDFSIAHIMNTGADITMPTGFVGSPRYMSPEQIQEDEITHQTDIFSLGIVMYELLTGRHPFDTKSFSRLIYKIVNESPALLSTQRQGMPKIFQRIVHHTLQKNHESRYQQASNIVADLSLAFDYLDSNFGNNLSENVKFTKLKEMNFFQVFSVVEIWEIVRTCKWQKYARGTELVFPEDIEDAIFIVVTGSFDIYKDGTLVDSIKEGDYFGLTGKCLDTNTQTKFRTQKELQLLKLNHTLLEHLSVSCQSNFSKAMLNALVKKSLLPYSTNRQSSQ